MEELNQGEIPIPKIENIDRPEYVGLPYPMYDYKMIGRDKIMQEWKRLSDNLQFDEIFQEEALIFLLMVDSEYLLKNPQEEGVCLDT